MSATIYNFRRVAVVRDRPGFSRALRRAKWRDLRRMARLCTEVRATSHPTLKRRVPEKARFLAALIGRHG